MSQSFDNWFHIARKGFVHGLTGILNDDLRLSFIFLLICLFYLWTRSDKWCGESASYE